MSAKNRNDFVSEIKKAILLKDDVTYQSLIKKELSRNTWDYYCNMIISRMVD